MDSGPKKHPKLRLRFNFSGDKPKTTKSTRDGDILDSLSRQTHPQTLPVLETVGENQQLVEPVAPQVRPNGHPGRSALIIFLGGFLAVWGYGYATKAYEVPYLSLLLQNQAVIVGIQTLTAHPLPAIGAVSVLVLLSALYARHRRKGTPISS